MDKRFHKYVIRQWYSPILIITSRFSVDILWFWIYSLILFIEFFLSKLLLFPWIFTCHANSFWINYFGVQLDSSSLRSMFCPLKCIWHKQKKENSSLAVFYYCWPFEPQGSIKQNMPFKWSCLRFQGLNTKGLGRKLCLYVLHLQNPEILLQNNFVKHPRKWWSIWGTAQIRFQAWHTCSMGVLLLQVFLN